MENFIVSINCVIPMFLILCTGLLVRRMRIVPEDFFHHLSTLSFRALLPCLLFYNIYSADFHEIVHPGLMIFLAGWLLLWFGGNYALFAHIEPDARRRGAYIQNSFRSNIAVIGVSLAQVMMNAEGVALLSLAISIVVPMYNILAVFTLESCRGGCVDIGKLLRGVIHNPLIIACLLGLILALLRIQLPDSVERAVSSIGNAGSVTTLLALGASFRLAGVRENLKPIAICCIERLILAPSAAVIPAIILGFRGNTLGTILICTATPTASTSYPMALACESDYEFTGQLVVITSLLCSLTLFVWIFVLKQLNLI